MEDKNKPSLNPKRSRSCAYPALMLADGIALAKKIFDNLGIGPHRRASLAQGLGYSSFSGPASAKIGALVQFGLLGRSSGSYSITSLAKEAFSYPDEISLPAIINAASHPVLYQKLMAKFCGNSLPRDLPAVLIANYGITRKAAIKAAADFIATMEFSGLLKNGILEDPLAARQPAPENVKKEPLEDIGDRELNDGRIKIELPGGVAILFPKQMAYRLSMGEFAPEIENLGHKIYNNRQAQ